MKKFISIILVTVLLCTFAACGKKGSVEKSSETESTTEQTTVLDPTVYSETNLEGVKTFTEKMGYEVASVDKNSFNSTAYTYVVGDKSDEVAYQYQEYIRSLGFVLEANNLFVLENKGSIRVETKDAENGRNVVITVSCDDKTSEARKKTAYSEVEKAFNNKEYKAVLEMLGKFDADYKDVRYFENYSVGMIAKEAGLLGSAYAHFAACKDSVDESSYMKEIEKYNGTYNYKDSNGTDHYVFIKNGKVSVEMDVHYTEGDMKFLGIDRNNYIDLHYFYPDPVFTMLYELVVTGNEDETQKITIEFSSVTNVGEVKRDVKFTFIDNKNGTYTFTGVNDDTKYVNGVYTKISDRIPE